MHPAGCLVVAAPEFLKALSRAIGIRSTCGPFDFWMQQQDVFPTNESKRRAKPLFLGTTEPLFAMSNQR
jgi:hypothetical protein